MIKNGFCDDITNIPSCQFDGGDCCGANVDKYYCQECFCIYEPCPYFQYKGDGHCDPVNDVIECDFDGGDCIDKTTKSK